MDASLVFKQQYRKVEGIWTLKPPRPGLLSQLLSLLPYILGQIYECPGAPFPSSVNLQLLPPSTTPFKVQLEGLDEI